MLREGAKWLYEYRRARILSRWGCLTQEELKIKEQLNKEQLKKEEVEKRQQELSAMVHRHLSRRDGLRDAQEAYTRLRFPCIILRTKMMGAYSDERSLRIFRRILLDGVAVDAWALVTVIATCCRLRDAQEGLHIFHLATESRLAEREVAVRNALVNMLGRFGRVRDARDIFDSGRVRDILSWNAMLAAYVQNGQAEMGNAAFRQMLLEGLPLNLNTLRLLLEGFEGAPWLRHGRFVISLAIDAGFASDPRFAAAAVSMLGDCNASVAEMVAVLERISLWEWDAVLWTAALAAVGNAENGLAVRFFREMQLYGVHPDAVTFAAVLNSCASLELGASVHARAAVLGMGANVAVANAAITMYNRCGDLGAARRVFDTTLARDAVTWNALLAAYAARGATCTGHLFRLLLQDGGAPPDRATLVTLLSGVCHVTDGRLAHVIAREAGLEGDVNVRNALVHMYGRCGCVTSARGFFLGLPACARDVVTWNSMLTSLGLGQEEEATTLYRGMLQHGILPNRVSFLALLRCGLARTVLAQIVESGALAMEEVQSTLLSAYARAGDMAAAKRVQERLCNSGSSSGNIWNALIAASGDSSGDSGISAATEAFRGMVLNGIGVGEATFVALLSACAHAGALQQGCASFSSMQSDFDIAPAAEHGGCIVDLLARSGHLAEAEVLLSSLTPGCPKSWLSLLTACKVYGDVHRAGATAQHAIRLEPHESAGYVMLANAMT